MSTLTKILIVLLTLSSIFVCGIVVTYVANADNYKTISENSRAAKDSLTKKVNSLTQQLNEKTEARNKLENELSGEIASLRTEMDTLRASLSTAEREKAALVQKLDGWASIVKDFRETNDQQAQLLQKTLDDVKNIEVEQIRDRKELAETSTTLIEKMAIIETLQTQKKALIEEKVVLQAKLNRYLQPMGQTAAAFVPAASARSRAWPATRVTKNINLKALVKDVDLKNSLAGISIGSADGVKEGMKFHVTRGNEFVCDILIIEVDTEQAVGVLDLIQQNPRIGDNASTNL